MTSPKKEGWVALVRPKEGCATENNEADMRLARRLAVDRHGWMLLIGDGSKQRQADMERVLGSTRAKPTIWAPIQLNASVASTYDGRVVSGWESVAAGIASYLMTTGFQLMLKECAALVFHFDESAPSLLIAAVTEAASVFPGVSVAIGDTCLDMDRRWQLRRDGYVAPQKPPSSDIRLGVSKAMVEVEKLVGSFADSSLPVLILGETGTGKGKVAELLHKRSARAGRFVSVNAAELTTDTADSILFGHVKGAFTGAVDARTGRIREARGGTFFLDEVFELSERMQARLLTALNKTESGIIEVIPVGSTQVDSVSARLVVAAQRDPRTNAPSGRSGIREDLFYRLACGVIEIPPLRQRLEDLPLLCGDILRGFQRGARVCQKGLEVLRGHEWPGNVRELKLVLSRTLMTVGPKEGELPPELLRRSIDILPVRGGVTARPMPLGAIRWPCNLKELLRTVELDTMEQALEKADGVGSEAGRLIGLGNNSHNFARRLAVLRSEAPHRTNRPAIGGPSEGNRREPS